MRVARICLGASLLLAFIAAASARELFAQELFAQELFAQELFAQERFAQELFAQEAFAQEPVSQARVSQERVSQEPFAQEASAQEPGESLKLYAVHILRPPRPGWTGYGVYLGNGYVITAAHVAGLSLWTDVHVDIAGQDLPATVIKRGQFHAVDLTLVSVDESRLPVSLRMRRMPVCADPPWTDEGVIVVTPEGIASSHVVSPSLLPHSLAPNYRTAIADVATTGNSGSGVFDARRKCLLGIVSGVIREPKTHLENGQPVKERVSVAKYFVPSAEIADFIPQDVHY